MSSIPDSRKAPVDSLRADVTAEAAGRDTHEDPNQLLHGLEWQDLARIIFVALAATAKPGSLSHSAGVHGLGQRPRCDVGGSWQCFEASQNTSRNENTAT